MRVITGGKGTGKTKKMIEEANLLHAYNLHVAFVTHSRDYEKHLRDAGLDKHIPVYSMGYNNIPNLNDTIVFVDNIELILMNSLRCENLCISVDNDNSLNLGKEFSELDEALKY